MLDISEFKQKYNYAQATPMMQQYLDIKINNPDCLILFRLGDFYELFFEDALIAAKILGIAIAKRNKQDDEYIPMCGVPFHALDAYLNKLIEADYKIAICEQMESPEEAKKRGHKSVVRRDVIRIITPGTITEENIVNQNEPNYLVSLNISKDTCAICYVDINTAEFAVLESNLELFSSELARLAPKELLLSERIQDMPQAFNSLNAIKTKFVYQVDSYFDYKKNKHIIENFYNIHTVEAIGNLSPLKIGAIGAVIEYIKLTQKANLPRVPYPKVININKFMQIDPSTRRNLEIIKNSCGDSKGSLLHTINKTITKGGSRLLYQYLAAPLAEADKINSRILLTEFFHNNPSLTTKIRQDLKLVGDIERSLTRMSMRRATPPDLMSIKDTIGYALNIKECIFQTTKLELPTYIQKIFNDLSSDEQLHQTLSQALLDEVPNHINNGGFINRKYHSRIIELYSLIENSTEIVDKLKRQYQQETGIESLKVNGNNLLGLYIEVAQRFASKMTDPKFIHKQTLSTAIRYTTVELRELESAILSAKNSVIALEQDIFHQLCELALNSAIILKKLAKSLSILDVFCNFAFIAEEYDYVQPIIDNSKEFIINDGRHPVVERSLISQNQSFIVNNCHLLKHQHLWLITGPNMAGKSTFLRQNAHIAILAHIGCYVPAKYVHIGVIDKIFSRVGAADDLSKGQSTFMVEMVETSAILAQSTERSFIILDEIGRGTSTYDGVSIAWACLEYIHDKLKCRSLFATHYHELTVLEQKLASLRNYNIKITENNGKLLLLHQIIAGAADRSYGINVAEMAGLPSSVINRAKQILYELENSAQSYVEVVNDNILANGNHSTADAEYAAKYHKLAQQLQQLEIDTLSPMTALQTLYEFKKQLE